MTFAPQSVFAGHNMSAGKSFIFIINNVFILYSQCSCTVFILYLYCICKAKHVCRAKIRGHLREHKGIPKCRRERGHPQPNWANLGRFGNNLGHKIDKFGDKSNRGRNGIRFAVNIIEQNIFLDTFG